MIMMAPVAIAMEAIPSIAGHNPKGHNHFAVPVPRNRGRWASGVFVFIPAIFNTRLPPGSPPPHSGSHSTIGLLGIERVVYMPHSLRQLIPGERERARDREKHAAAATKISVSRDRKIEIDHLEWTVVVGADHHNIIHHTTATATRAMTQRSRWLQLSTQNFGHFPPPDD